MSLTLRNVQIDCPPDGFAPTAAFWAAALGATSVDRDGGRYVHLHGARTPVEVHLQRLDDGPSRLHLDLVADDVDAEVARLEGLGGRVVARPEPGIVVLGDPSGLVLCVVADGAPPAPLADPTVPGPRLSALIVDVPADQMDEVAAFWSAALGAAGIHTSPDDGGRWMTLHGVRVSGGVFPVEVQAVGADRLAPPPRFHLDVEADDVAGAAAWLESMGARRRSTDEGCIVLADPSDHLLCVVAPRDGAGAAAG